MFKVETKKIVKALGAVKTLIPNKNLLLNMELMTLVKVGKKGFFEVPTYEPLNIKLPELLEEEKEPELYCEEKVLVKDFSSVSKIDGTASAGGGYMGYGGNISGGAERLDGLTEPVSLMKKEIYIQGKSFRKINQNKVNKLKLEKTEKLACVHQIVYNTGDVQILSAHKNKGSVSASFEKLFTLSVEGSKVAATFFTVPEKSIFAYGLSEIILDKDELNIPFGFKGYLKSCTGGSSPQMKPDPELSAVKELEMKLSTMQPLADLPESTRRELLKKLCEVLKNQDDLSELEETLEQFTAGTYERPQYQTVSSFLDVLEVSNFSSDVKEIVYMLVSALNGLPDEVPALLVSCDVEALDFFIYKATNWREIQRDVPTVVQNEFSWMLDLIETTKKTKDNDDSNEHVILRFPPEKLREMVCVAMKGINILRS